MKKILNVLAIVVVVIFAGYNVCKAQQPVVMSDIAMENVEALADMECQGTDGWQQLKYEYYSLEVPSTWVFRFGGADQSSIHKRNIRVKNSKGERVEYELGTLNWGTEIRKGILKGMSMLKSAASERLRVMLLSCMR